MEGLKPKHEKTDTLSSKLLTKMVAEKLNAGMKVIDLSPDPAAILNSTVPNKKLWDAQEANDTCYGCKFDLV